MQKMLVVKKRTIRILSTTTTTTLTTYFYHKRFLDLVDSQLQIGADLSRFHLLPIFHIRRDPFLFHPRKVLGPEEDAEEMRFLLGGRGRFDARLGGDDPGRPPRETFHTRPN